MEETSLTPAECIVILKRRKWAFLLPFLFTLFIATAVALLLPSIYRSTSSILIEQREIPAEYVTSSMTSFAEQRIQSINQRILTSSRLVELIKQFDLYPELRQKKTIDEIIEIMREDVRLKPVNVEIADRRSGRTATATIAFTLSYDGKNPAKVQRVANKITSLFLAEDLKVRKEQASSTYDFLLEEKERIQNKLSESGRKLAVFKKQNMNSLPEIFQMNMQSLDHIKRSIELAKESLRNTREKKEQIEEQLANTSINRPLYQRSPKEDDERRLEALKMELINLKTRFSDLYPDVVEIKQEIRELEEKVKISKKKTREREKQEDEEQRNPAYITLSSRLAGLKSDIKSFLSQIDDLENQARIYKTRISETPGVEERHNALLSERNNLIAKNNELQAKMMEANIAKELESKQKGERFTLVESARFPETPHKPNRIAIVLIGVVLALGAGFGVASVLEFSDTSFRDSETLSRLTGFPVLTQVPWIITKEDKAAVLKKRMVAISVSAAFTVVAVFLFDGFVMDLDVLLVKIINSI